MKRVLLFFTCMSIALSQSFANDRLLADFETGDPTGFGGWGGNFSIVDNPVTSDPVNTSSKAAKFESQQDWGAIALSDINPAFDIYKNSKIQFKVLCENAGKVTVNVWDSPAFSVVITQSFDISADQVNKWQLLEISTEGYKDLGYNTIQIQYNQRANMYVDDIVLLNVSTTKNELAIHTEPFGDFTAYEGDASAFTLWKTGAVAGGHVKIDWSNIPQMPGTSLCVNKTVDPPVAPFTLYGIDAKGFSGIKMEISYGYSQWWADPAILSCRPVIEFKGDDGAWIAVVTESEWPIEDKILAKMIFTCPSLPSTIQKVSIRFSPSSDIAYWIDDLKILGVVSNGTSIRSSELPNKSISYTENTVTVNHDQVNRIELFTVGGVKIATEIASSSMDISTLPKGVYIVKADTSDGVLIQKILKK